MTKTTRSTMNLIKYSAQHKVVPLDYITKNALLVKRLKECKLHFLYHGGNVYNVHDSHNKITIYFDGRLVDDTFNTNPPSTFDEKVQRYKNVFVYYVDSDWNKYIIYLK